MTRFVVGNVFLLLCMVCTAVSHLLIKAVIDEARASVEGGGVLRALLEPDRMLRGGLGGVGLGLAFVFWTLSLVRLDLSYAYPVACSSVLLVTFFSAIWLGEPVTPRVWLATVLVTAGVALLASSR